MSLFTRIQGTDQGTEFDKIAIHALASLLAEAHRGHVAPGAIISYFGLQGGDGPDAVRLSQLMAASPDAADFQRILKEVLYLVEMQVPGYTEEAQFWTRLEAAVTDQGGEV